MYSTEALPGNYVPLRGPVDEEGAYDPAHPGDLFHGESSEWEAIADLDQFFSRVYHYYCNHGFWCIVTQWVVELLTLGFTITFSGFLLLVVNWHGLLAAKCGVVAAEAGVEPCDLWKEGVVAHPLRPLTWAKVGVLLYLLIFSLYWLFCFVRFITQLRHLLEIRHFCNERLGMSERELQTSSWPELVERMVQSQGRQRLCLVRELTAHDIVSRIMRKENYMVGFVNKDVLALPLPSWLPATSAPSGAHSSQRALVLTKTLEWSLNWCILHYMFDENFIIRRDFSTNPAALRKRFMAVGAAMLCLSPFLCGFMLIYFFMRNAEQFYHHPSTAGSRRWSNLAKWKLREFNELQHMFEARLNASYEPASAYVKQFPSPIVSMLAKFVSFVTGALAALLLALALAKESLLEAELGGRNLFWYAAILGTILAVSRALITEEHSVFDPEGAMAAVAQHTHHVPKHWRGKANTPAVRAEFEALFQYKARLFLEEMASIFITPFLLWFCVPKCVDPILEFVAEFTVHVDGVGHVCSLSVFDFEAHGNSKYGSPFHAAKARRSTHGKMEKSFLSFKSNYPQWEPPPPGKQMLSVLADFRSRHEAATGEGSPARGGLAFELPPRGGASSSLRPPPPHWSGHRQPQAASAMHHSSMTPAVSVVAANTGPVDFNQEQVSQLYWLELYHEAAAASGQGAEEEDEVLPAGKSPMTWQRPEREEEEQQPRRCFEQQQQRVAPPPASRSGRGAEPLWRSSEDRSKSWVPGGGQLGTAVASMLSEPEDSLAGLREEQARVLPTRHIRRFSESMLGSGLSSSSGRKENIHGGWDGRSGQGPADLGALWVHQRQGGEMGVGSPESDHGQFGGGQSVRSLRDEGRLDFRIGGESSRGRELEIEGRRQVWGGSGLEETELDRPELAAKPHFVSDDEEELASGDVVGNMWGAQSSGLDFREGFLSRRAPNQSGHS